MATSQLAYAVERNIGHDGSAITQQDVSNYSHTADLGGDTMKALVWMGKNKVEVRDVPKPRIIEPRDVILRVTGTTVCGSDLHLLHGTVIQLSEGDILGHEFCGVVDTVGPDVQKVQVGRRYVASFQIACGDCFFCKQKLSSQCERTCSNRTAAAMYGSQTAGMFGYSHFTGGFAGGQAEYVRVPLGDVNLLALPDDVPDEKALYLSDVLATSYHCAHDTVVHAGDHVAVFGAGPVGQMAAVFAANAGAARVVLVDTEPRLSTVRDRWPSKHIDKLALVDFRELSSGAVAAVAAGGAGKQTVVSRLRELCGGRGPDVALECAAGEYAKGWLHWLEMLAGAETDTSEILNEMVESVRNFGRCGVTGVYVGYTNHFNIGSLMQRGIRLIGNGQAPVHLYWEMLLEQIRSGELDPLQMVSHRACMEDMAKVYYAFDKREDGIQKVFVETRFSLPACEGSPKLTRF